MKKILFFLLAGAFLTSCATTQTSSVPKADKDPLFSGAEAAAVAPSKEAAAEKSAEATGETAAVTPKIEKLDKDTVAIIGNYRLTRSRYNIITEYMKKRYDYKLTPEQEREFIEFIVNKKLMALEARAAGYAEREEIKVKYNWDFDDIVSSAFYEDNVAKKSPVTTAQAKQYYDKNKEDFVEMSARHILIKNKNMADNIHRRILSGGESFEELAKKYSDDETTKQSGGDLGYFSKGVMVKEFEDAAFALSRGEMSRPVKTIYGWHIIRANDRRQISFEESKDKIVKMVTEMKTKEIFDEMLGSLVRKYGATINEEYFK
ncbi:MAG TPA: hypothetical protein ENN43_02385 [bacterium]|nr:hypothetical protein [bacterium]